MDHLNTRFLNEAGREYDVRITVPIAHAFCKQERIKLEGLNPLLLDIGQLLDLCYMATRSTKLKALEETKGQFLEGLEGESFSKAQDCVTNSLVLFSLKVLPKKQAKVLKDEVTKLQALVQAGEESESTQEGHGNGATSSESVGQLESAPTEQPAALEN